MMELPRVAVIGGGIFGVTAAIEMAKVGYPVDLFEKKHDLLTAASGINQYRLHRGYHYPRSIETALSCRTSESSFMEIYGEAVVNHHEHYYGIASHDSLVSAEDFLNFCRKLELAQEVSYPDIVDRKSLDVCVRVRENLFDPQVLRKICKQRLQQHGVRVYLDTPATWKTIQKYDFSVVATYATLNEFLGELAGNQKYQFEICEKPVVRLPSKFRNKSIVILDGPFMCVDPIGSSDLFVLGNVVHAIHHRNVGLRPEIPPALVDFLDTGIIETPPVTKFKNFIDSAAEFFPEIVKAEFVGSMFTIRTVLPGKDDTDERPTLVTYLNDRIVSIFSGKISTCVEAAREVVSILKNKDTLKHENQRRLSL